MDPFTALELARDQDYWAAASAIAAWMYGAVALSPNGTSDDAPDPT
jgi:hypothetical protein